MSYILDFKEWVGQDDGIDDSLDRLNRKYTVIILLLVMMPVCTKQFLGQPIRCFSPQYFSDAQGDYVNSYCWTASTYYIVWGQDVTYKGEDLKLNTPIISQPGPNKQSSGNTGFMGTLIKGRKIEVSYYQWVPIILGAQAFCFHVPFILWHSLATNSGIRVAFVLNGIGEIAGIHAGREDKDSLLMDIVDQIDSFLGLRHYELATTCCTRAKRHICIGRRYGNYLFFLYLCIKLLYLLNLIGQLYALKVFLGTDLFIHGLNVITGLFYDQEWRTSPRFPTSTICEYTGDAQIHGYLQKHICQCVLPVNLYNDKMYAILTLYFTILITLTSFSTLMWIYKNSHWRRVAFIKDYLTRTRRMKGSGDKRLFNQFVNLYMRRDGVFLLQLMDVNVGGVFTAAIVDRLWDIYRKRQEQIARCNRNLEEKWAPEINGSGSNLLDTISGKLNQRLDASAPAFSKEDMRDMESAHGHPPPPSHALTRGYQNGGGDVV